MSTQRDMMSGPRRQRGMAMIQWIILILIVGGTATVAIRTIPHYIDFYTMVSVVEALPKNEVHVMSKQKIRDSLRKRFKINNIRDLDIAKVVGIERKRGATAVTLDYEIREHLFYNIDLVMSFNKRFDYS
jgi:translation initiation factor RLI1